MSTTDDRAIEAQIERSVTQYNITVRRIPQRPFEPFLTYSSAFTLWGARRKAARLVRAARAGRYDAVSMT